jgi:cytochrome P450
MLSTGYETIGDALTWVFYLLCKNPSVAQRMQDEIAEVLGGQSPEADDIPKLTYVNQVFSESLRIYPPTWIFVRVANGDDILPSGVQVQAATKIYLSQYISHRDPRWFPEPERFDPERFAVQEIEKRPRFTYFPFGGGARVCIGEHLARMEAVMVLAMIVPRFRFELVQLNDPLPQPGITLRPRDGLRVRVFPQKDVKVS